VVEFVTLFLSLVSGVHRVEVAVGPEVAAVEILVDGRVTATLTGPPWVVEVDLGQSLRPLHLEAVARSPAGAVVGRSFQAVNLPRPPVETRLAVEPDAEGRPTAVQMVWEATTDVRPTRVDLRLDRSPLEVDATGRAALPPLDLQTAHLLSAEVRFPGNLLATAQAMVGGRYGAEVRTELTAVPLLAADGHPPTAVEVARSLRADGERVDVETVEGTGPRLLAVVDPAAFPGLRRLAWMVDGRRLRGFPRDLLAAADAEPVEAGHLCLVHPRADTILLRGEQRVVFPIHGPLTLERQPLPWVLSHARLEELSPTPVRMADAVAAAGVAAAATARPRAVLALFGGEAADGSLYAPAEVRAYLEALQVPLVVWRVGRHPPPADWGAADDVSSLGAFRDAATRLENLLERQSIAWVSGRHLPTSFAVPDPQARFELAR